MKTKDLKKVVGFMVLALAVVAFQPPANAAPFVPYMQLGFYDPASMSAPLFIDDNGVGDANALVGAMSFSASTPNWVISGSFGVTYDVLGSASSPRLDLTSLNVSSSAGGDLLVGVSAMNYVFPQQVLGGWQFDVGGTTDGFVQFDLYSDPANTLFQGNLLNSAFFSAPPEAFSGSFSGGFDPMVFDPTLPYSLSINALIFHEGAGATSFDAHMAVPEPATLLLLGFGLLALLGVRRFTH